MVIKTACVCLCVIGVYSIINAIKADPLFKLKMTVQLQVSCRSGGPVFKSGVVRPCQFKSWPGLDEDSWDKYLHRLGLALNLNMFRHQF